MLEFYADLAAKLHCARDALIITNNCHDAEIRETPKACLQPYWGLTGNINLFVNEFLDIKDQCAQTFMFNA